MKLADANQNLLNHFDDQEIEVMFNYELTQCSKLDLNRPLDVCGYYYDQNDTNKIHAHFKDGCIFSGDTELNVPILVSLIRSSDLVEVIYNLQSLHTDKFGEDMLTTWIEIEQLILLLRNIKLAESLNENLKQWQKNGVTEIYLSWYESPKSIN